MESDNNHTPMEDAYEAFLERFTENRMRIFGYILALAPQYQDAEDIFQRCSVVLWRKYEQLDSPENFLPWACRVAQLEVFNYRRVKARSRLVFDDELLTVLAEERLERQERSDRRLEALDGCMKKLTESQQSFLQAAYAPGQSIKELAERLGRASQTVYNRLFKIRKQLHDCIESRLNAGETAP